MPDATPNTTQPLPAKPDWAAIRRDFPILDQEVHGKPLAYLDNAATSQKPRAVIDALVRYYERDNANVHRGIHELSNRSTTAFEAARERVATFIHARKSCEIIFTRGTTEGINLVAQTWGNQNIHEGDTLLLTEMEHHSNLVPWQMLASRSGAKLAFLRIDAEGVLDPDGIYRLLTEGVKLLVLPHISNSLGTINPVRELCARARALGITTLVDAAQSAGHLPLDVLEIGCDFLVFSGHKMCGPTGIGVLYGREEILDAMPPWQGGGEMISSVRYTDSTWNTLPYKFEAGTPDIAGAIGLHAALDYLEAIGRAEIFAHDSALTAYAWEKLAAIPGIRLFGPRENRGALVSFLLPEVHAHDVVTLADQDGIALRGGHHCTQPLMRKLGVASTARASFYFYNTRDEIDRLVASLERINHFFTREL